MSKKHRDAHFAEFRGHTVFKHGVVNRYVRAWIQILKRKHSQLFLVDGFAGKGRDDTGKPGSPLLLAMSAAQLRAEGAEIHLIAIEPRRDWYDALKANLAEFDAEAGGRVSVARLRHGTLAEVADEAFALVGDNPVFVFLDPFGADGLDLGVVKRTLALSKGEVFALFSHQAVCRHLAVLSAERRSDRARRAVSESPGLFPDLDAEWLAGELADAESSDAGLMPTKEAAERILVQLFGSKDEVQRILDMPQVSWSDEVVKAYLKALQNCGATHITRIAIFDEEQQCAYFLIHAAKSPRAAYKMKEAVNSATSKSDLSERIKHRIRWAHSARLDEVVAAVIHRFAGMEVRWSDKDSLDCVRGFALSETPMFCDQAKDLQSALEPYVIEQRPLRYRFPS